jgi:hypothetical protein
MPIGKSASVSAATKVARCFKEKLPKLMYFSFCETEATAAAAIQASSQ